MVFNATFNNISVITYIVAENGIKIYEFLTMIIPIINGLMELMKFRGLYLGLCDLSLSV